MCALKLSNKVLGTRMLLISLASLVFFFAATCVLWELFGVSANWCVLLGIMFMELSLGFVFAGDKIRKM